MWFQRLALSGCALSAHWHHLHIFSGVREVAARSQRSRGRGMSVHKISRSFKTAPEPNAADTSQDADENRPNLKMAERADWTLFRSVDGLQQKAGVPAKLLRRLVIKELT